MHFHEISKKKCRETGDSQTLIEININTIVSEKFIFECMLKLLLAANSKHIVTALDYQHLPTYDIKVQIEIAIFPKN